MGLPCLAQDKRPRPRAGWSVLGVGTLWFPARCCLLSHIFLGGRWGFISLCGQIACRINLPRETICDNTQGHSWNISKDSELFLLFKQFVLFIYRCITSYLFVHLPVGALKCFPLAWALVGPLGSYPSRFLIKMYEGMNGAGFHP